MVDRLDAKFSQNSGAVLKDSNIKSLEYFGGLKNIIPFFNIIRFCDFNEQEARDFDILNNIF